MESDTALLLVELGRDVALLPWPAQQHEREELARRELPRLLLLEPGLAPPRSGSCLEDWTRSNADEDEIRVRLEALRERAARHKPTPQLAEFGQLEHRGKRTQLSPIEELLFAGLLERFGEPVADEVLVARAWPEGGGGKRALRVHLSRMRRRLAPLGLEIRSRRGHGHVLQHTTAPPPHER